MRHARHELGVLKALGYSSRQVVGTIALENALGGLIGGAMAVLALSLVLREG